jgi:transposase
VEPLDPRDRRIAELEAHLAAALGVIDRLTAEVTRLSARVQDLEARLHQNSSNSSRPPSSDAPSAGSTHSPRLPSGRSRGGQPGHQGHKRTLLPPERLSGTKVLKPHHCRRCGAPLCGHDPAPLRHQVIDIPRVLAMAFEYQLHALECPHCHITTRAELPPGVPWGNFGPRLQAFIAVCAGAYRLSQRTIEQLIADIYGVEVSLGTVAHLEQQASEAVAAPVAEAAQVVQAQPVVHADETSWREAKQKAWLWVVVAANMAVFLIRRSRGADVARELLGACFRGLLVTDRWAAYNWVDQKRRQLCWAHLVRQFAGFEDYGGMARLLGLALQGHCHQMFEWWHRVRDGTLSRATFRRYMRPVREQILDLLGRGVRCGVPKVAGRCQEILKLQDALFTFVQVPGVEPTNNAAERAIRQAVLWRKSSYGTDSEVGSTFVARILTVVTTLRLQHRHVLDWMTEACEARLARRAPPSLLLATHAMDSYALAA